MRYAIAAALLLAAAAPLAAQKVTPAITAALADTSRPAEQRARDAARKPAEILAFAGIKPGQKVADFVMGGGYWTRILSPLVGAKGKVYAYQPAEFIKFRAAYGEEQKTAVAGLANTVALSDSFGALVFPEPLDAIITVQNYHDLFLAPFPKGTGEAVTRKLYNSLKPGGVLLVVDHVANADPENKAPTALHRIDPNVARRELEKAGFRFAGKLDVLRNTTDPHTANVFDASIRGKTDQFVFKFVRPRT
ncbi:methyltransferase [Sphingomonas sp. BT-65]|uniref:class I SAM-dependent methyltransferase n=1 Tax=Sphingomonas sp. BT-65 TaxID=2989821 RepID=UPI002235C241|nr:methyltransferase [Sphingomonas sp. BT-65]MCW4461825.1 methyltransferase [Sphingomonas sp. BT-65]